MRKKHIAICVACACVVVAVAAAVMYTMSARSSQNAWNATQDDSLNVLSMQVSGGNVVAMTGDGWAARDGYVQLQLSGGSIPGQTIESVIQDGSDLTVTLKSEGDGAASLDLLLTEYRLEGGDVSSVERVLIDYGTGEVVEAQKAYE